MTTAIKAVPHEREFKFKGVEHHLTPDGGDSYSVEAYPQYIGRTGTVMWSQYEISMYIRDEPTFAELSKLAPGNIVKLAIVPGKIKRNKDGSNKPDDGKFENYYWNVLNMADASAEPSTVTEPPTTQQAPGEEPISSARPQQSAWIDREAIISASWAIKQAIAYYQNNPKPPGMDALMEMAWHLLELRDALAVRHTPQDSASDAPEPTVVAQQGQAVQTGSSAGKFSSIPPFMGKTLNDLWNWAMKYHGYKSRADCLKALGVNDDALIGDLQAAAAALERLALNN